MKTYTLIENGICLSSVQYTTLEAALAARAQYVYADREIAEINPKTWQILSIVK